MFGFCLVECSLQFVNQFNETKTILETFGSLAHWNQTKHKVEEKKKHPKEDSTTNLGALCVAIDILFLYGRNVYSRAKRMQRKEPFNRILFVLHFSLNPSMHHEWVPPLVTFPIISAVFKEADGWFKQTNQINRNCLLILLLCETH